MACGLGDLSDEQLVYARQIVVSNHIKIYIRKNRLEREMLTGLMDVLWACLLGDGLAW